MKTLSKLAALCLTLATVTPVQASPTPRLVITPNRMSVTLPGIHIETPREADLVRIARPRPAPVRVIRVEETTPCKKELTRRVKPGHRKGKMVRKRRHRDELLVVVAPRKEKHHKKHWKYAEAPRRRYSW